MAINKVVFGSEVLVDLTADTVEPSALAAGYTAHDRSGAPIEGASTLDSDTSADTAAVGELLAGRTAHARGALLTGAMPNNGAVAGEIAERDGAYAVPAGYHDGSGTVAIAAAERAKIVPANVKSGVEILGVTGAYGGESVTARAAEATPATSEQVVLPGEGYDYLSQVTVAAIPYAESPNAAGGTTATIG